MSKVTNKGYSLDEISQLFQELTCHSKKIIINEYDKKVFNGQIKVLVNSMCISNELLKKPNPQKKRRYSDATTTTEYTYYIPQPSDKVDLALPHKPRFI